jgi:tetratricopeptide (TPR) repeat protein
MKSNLEPQVPAGQSRLEGLYYRLQLEPLNIAPWLDVFEAYRHANRFEVCFQLWQLASREVTDPLTLARLRLMRGLMYSDQGDWRKAEKNYQNCLVVFQSYRDRTNVANIYNNLGELFLRQSRWNEARDAFDQAYHWFHSSGKTAQAGTALANRASAEYYLGHIQAAIRGTQEALAIARTLQNHNGMEKALNNLGIFYRHEQQFEAAIACYTESIEICRALGDERGVAHSQVNLGAVYYGQRQLDEAEAVLQQAMQTLRHTNDLPHLGSALGNLGLVSMQRRDWQQTELYLMESLSIARSTGDALGESDNLNNLGRLAKLQSQWETALAYYQADALLSRQIGATEGYVVSLLNQTLLYLDQRSWEQAELCIREAWPLALLSEARYLHGRFALLKGWLAIEVSTRYEAHAFWREGLEIARTITPEEHARLSHEIRLHLNRRGRLQRHVFHVWLNAPRQGGSLFMGRARQSYRQTGLLLITRLRKMGS